MDIKKKDIRNAISKFKNGYRPFKCTESRSWYVIDHKGKPFPLKYIYAIAVNRPPGSFNTSEPISVLTRLDIELLHRQKDPFENFNKKVKKALKNPKSRGLRLAKASKKPKSNILKIVIFERNPDVVAEVLARANGKCEECGSNAPFIRKSYKSPYLEVHHKKFLSKGGEDSV